jgi:tRNA A-37 threonylcarbamoyl transferase component Bud32
VGFVLGTIFLAWALALLAYNYRRLESRNERRRVRIVALGFVLTFFALTLRMGTTTLGPLAEVGLRYQRSSPWQFVEIVFVAAAPICMTYAILRHRVFDIHVMIRLGLRYAVARGVLLSILPVAGLVLVFDVLFHRSEPVSEIVAHRGLFYVALGTGALLLHVKRGTWMDALDRRFFRERYDAYQLLSAVAEDIRRSPSFDEAARQVIARIASALHPEGVSLMMRRPGESMYQTVAAVNEHVGCIPADARLVALARVLNKPLENPPSGKGWLQQQLPRAEVKLLRRARLEWLFPVVLGATGPEAFLLVGPKRSEEPYSREDRMMLQVIAASLALVLAGPAVDSASGFAECPECGTCYDSETGRCDRDDSALLKSPYSRMLAGRYRLDRRLGRGGMGSVYEVADTLLERRVAVKVIRQDWIASADALARFRREAKAAASFSHAHVVTVHDFGVADDGRAYLVMERLEGRTLREELRERRSLEPTRALGILRAVAAAVVTAHERRMIHRDLKPDNIFLARSEDGELVKVLDFGLVKPLGSADADSMAGTAPGALIGTLAYMSPEQRASEAPTESWDIWALTVTAFEMLTGVHPFAMYADPGATLGGHRDTIRPVSPVTLSAPVAGFFERALSADAAHRPTSVRQLIEELEAVL